MLRFDKGTYLQAQRTLVKTGTVNVASKKTELAVWGQRCKPPQRGVLGAEPPTKFFRGFRFPKLAYNNPKTN